MKNLGLLAAVTPAPTLVEDALEQFILETEDERELDAKYHPSSMWMCARAAILAVRLVTPTSVADAQAKRIFRIGHMYHGLVQDALQYGGADTFCPEFKIDVPAWNVVGAGDGLLEVNGLWYVLEIKSTKSLRYTPKEDHLKQASVYFTAARDFGYVVWGDGRLDGDGGRPPLGDKLVGIILVYLEKSNLEMREFFYSYDPKWRPAIEDRVKELDSYRLVRVDDLPPPLPKERGKDNWFTGYCNYKGSGLCCGDFARSHLETSQT